MRRGAAAGVVACAAALCAGCTSSAPVVVAEKAPPADAAPAVVVRDRAGAWTADPRWTDRVREVEAAGPAAVARLGPDTGLAFERGREPVVVFDEAAPDEGDVAPRFVDGVRRPVIRIRPRALLSGEFWAHGDLAPLVVEGAILVGAGEREAPPWVARGVAVVVGGSFESALHRRALGGGAVVVREADLFGGGPADPVAAGARARALARIARSERPFARFLQALAAGRSEDAALAEIGIGGLAFLDAATDTERARAARSLADGPMLAALRDARTSLATGDAARADAALAPFATHLEDATLDPWIVADVRLCLAQIALSRGESKAAKSSLDAALASSKVVRVREARVLEMAVAPAAQRPALEAALAADWPDPAKPR